MLFFVGSSVGERRLASAELKLTMVLPLVRKDPHHWHKRSRYGPADVSRNRLLRYLVFRRAGLEQPVEYAGVVV